MAGLIAMAGVALVWLCFLAPDALDERLRKGLIALASLTLVISIWSTAKLIEAQQQARANAKFNYQRSERKKREIMELMRRDQEALGYSQPPSQ